MGRITEQMIRRRAEHNEGLLATLEEVALHQQNIERIELIGHLCPKLRILYLQNNLISKIQNLHKLKDLEYLNLAVNNITKVQNLQRCESLTKLDLTVNFIPKAGLLSICSLADNHALRELILMGNPCTDWPGYREYVVGKLPQLTRLDGRDIKPSERIAARQVADQLDQQLRAELASEGVDVGVAAAWEDDSIKLDEAGEVAETGYVDENGELRRPWCPATRILEHREQEKSEREAEQKKAAGKEDPFAPPPAPPRREDFPELEEDEVPLQRNEGQWEFTLDESEDSTSLVLEVQVGRYLDTSLIKADVRPTFVRLLIKGRLLQLLLPAEVRPDASVAQRSKATGALVLKMPKERPDERGLDVTRVRPRQQRDAGGATSSAAEAAAATTSRPCQGASIPAAGPTAHAKLNAAASSGIATLRPITNGVRNTVAGGGGGGGGGFGHLSGSKRAGGAGSDELRRAVLTKADDEDDDGDQLPDL